MESFYEGEVVVLNSGGPGMTVLFCYPESVLCAWMDSNGVTQRDSFPNACVHKK